MRKRRVRIRSLCTDCLKIGEKPIDTFTGVCDLCKRRSNETHLVAVRGSLLETGKSTGTD